MLDDTSNGNDVFVDLLLDDTSNGNDVFVDLLADEVLARGNTANPLLYFFSPGTTLWKQQTPSECPTKSCGISVLRRLAPHVQSLLHSLSYVVCCFQDTNQSKA
jgi:hypothetical protein